MSYWVLSHAAYDVCWSDLDLGERPLVIDVPAVGATVGERTALAEAVRADLAAGGLRDGLELDEGLEWALCLLARPVAAVDVRVSSERGELRAMTAAGRGDSGVWAVLDADALHLHQVPAAELAASALSLLPEVPPAAGTSVAMPAELLDGIVRRESTLGEVTAAFMDAGLRAELARLVGEAVTAARTGVARFEPAGVDELGRRHGAGTSLTVLDTARGRFLFQRAPGSDGRPWLTISPCPAALLVERVAELGAAPV
ncbi:EspG family protein [Streptoalloteichus tenebrarius]|uniref:EspG family protein n=1 Tax=Streptoalloteichus tenebrarius (strain ATCC 17920 / DSM 40477 / JCM 4838 / CBS 697.72 / NBRC 16177 / NCIMB 11028 / NRRL B-12390 / A12253. 1 / ISP 5477) TaxID=1933 RepID=A0ABT1HYL0_STRSD|nr:ESX secretion-associated protein EspG [Streptoalloteichus tenebrarius]MCP2260613.1 EspG family protein [Streptoalloteichus tenebrarius]BFF01496.1 hypothetical protein GCM10020241_31710 [Streptoalloteichus tenebrarius]